MEVEQIREKFNEKFPKSESKNQAIFFRKRNEKWILKVGNVLTFLKRIKMADFIKSTKKWHKLVSFFCIRSRIGRGSFDKWVEGGGAEWDYLWIF